MSRACEVVGIDRSTPYTAQWQDDDEFQELLRMAEGMAADHLEAEAIRRAYDGVEEPVGFYRGSPSAYVRRYSDTLLIFLLKGSRPEKYADRHQHEHSGKDGEPIEHVHLYVPDNRRDSGAHTNGTNGAHPNGNGRPKSRISV